MYISHTTSSLKSKSVCMTGPPGSRCTVYYIIIIIVINIITTHSGCFRDVLHFPHLQVGYQRSTLI